MELPFIVAVGRIGIATKTSAITSDLSVVVAEKCDLATDFSVIVSDFSVIVPDFPVVVADMSVVVAEESDLATEIPATLPDKSVAATEKSATLPDLSVALSQACVVKTAIRKSAIAPHRPHRISVSEFRLTPQARSRTVKR